jgi:hypothetical protein
MNRIFKILTVFALISIMIIQSANVLAGNEDRVGQSGASELLINPWARSSGWGSVGTACTRGLEAMYTNIAGTAFTPKTELIFSRTMWLKGSGVNLNAFGLTQKVGETSVIGLSVMTMSFGDIPITTVDLPDGGVGSYTPTLSTIGISYAKMFSNSIYGGLTVKVISEKISNLSATGIAIDAGIQYITGENENIMFGISLKNVGPRMKYSGDGLSYRVLMNSWSSVQSTIHQRSAEFELPTSLNIGVAYDAKLAERHHLIIAASFVSNSFSKDQYSLGLEYRMMEYLMLRGAYTYEKGITKKADRTSVLTGPSAGLTVQVPFNKAKTSTFAIDYSYRATQPFAGTHSIGARINL